MTWLKLSDDFGDQCADLSSDAFRTHVEGLLWTMRRETGGRLSVRDVSRFSEVDDPDAAVRELLAAGFWREAEGAYEVVHHIEHQPEPDVIARRRQATAERVRRHRRKRAGLDVEPTGNGVTEHMTSNPVTERVTRDGSGRVGTGATTEPPSRCAVCKGEMDVYEEGQTSHPTCEPS